MGITQTIKKLLTQWRQLPLKGRVIGVSLFVILAGYGLLFVLPKNVAFAYSGQDCAPQLTIAPSSMKQVTETGFTVSFEDVVKLGEYPIASLKTCFSPVKPPSAGIARVAVSPFGSWFMAKQFNVHVGEAPKAQTTDFIGKTLPVTRPVKIQLSGTDEVFDYRFAVGEKVADCDHHNEFLYCPLDELDLTQGETYDVSLTRYFGEDKLGVIGAGKIKTLRAVNLVNSTLQDGQVVYDKPDSFAFEYDKTLELAKGELKKKDGTVMPVAIDVKDKSVVVSPKNELPRNTDYSLVLTEVEGEDGSSLDGPLTVNFTMSGGPKVVSSSAGTTGTATSGVITLTFDQDIANLDAISGLVSVKGLNAQVSGSGKTVTISYTADLCTDFSITVKKGFENAAGIVQQDDWSFAGRTICYTVQTIGYSVKGRAINAFVFGSGSKTVLFTGQIHGNEQSARLLMNAWISELDINARSIPAGTRVVVIPSVNPDGSAANTRTNANNVDLNRNYDTSDWKKDVETVNGAPFPGGGGSSAGSEPETKALMAYTIALAPALTMSYHASASYAIANTCGNSGALAETYAKLTGYRNMTGVSGAFSYQITGTYDDWICERLGRASVLIELSSNTSPEFSRNKAALWAMVKS